MTRIRGRTSKHGNLKQVGINLRILERLYTPLGKLTSLETMERRVIHIYVKNNTFFCITKHFKFVYPTEDWERILKKKEKNKKVKKQTNKQKATVEYRENIWTAVLTELCLSEEYSLWRPGLSNSSIEIFLF